ncbi:MAG TPA: hypothetical protein VMU54_23790 [Planctomycetota bacterium]|nr:hypothetical protein [Planctomycetota bacterium]
MGYLFLLGLGFVNVGFTVARSTDPPGAWIELDGPSIERRISAWDVLAMQGSDFVIPEPFAREEPWRPCPFVRLEDEGSAGSQTHTSFLLNSGGSGPEEIEGFCVTPSYPERIFPRRETGFQEWSAVRFLLNPLDVVLGLDNLQVSWGKGVSEVSVSTVLSRWFESLGTLLDRNTFLGVNVDMLGFEEYEGTHLGVIDARRGTPRINNLSTGLGLTFKF